MAGIDRTDTLIQLLARGRPITEAARLAGVSERTAHRRLEDPAVQAAIRDIRTEMFEASGGKMTDALDQAVQTLIDALGDESVTARLKAAGMLIDYVVRWREQADTDARIAELEAALTSRSVPRAA